MGTEADTRTKGSNKDTRVSEVEPRGESNPDLSLAKAPLHR